MSAKRLPARTGGRALLVFAALVSLLTGCVVAVPEASRVTVRTLAPTPVSSGASAATAATAATPSPGLDPDSGLPFAALAALPPEAAATMGLIVVGGPFPYAQDGAVFENREEILPDADDAYYHEYTVETPGSLDRGARRIVVGNQGEAYWTDDHYQSFRRIAP